MKRCLSVRWVCLLLSDGPDCSGRPKWSNNFLQARHVFYSAGNLRGAPWKRPLVFFDVWFIVTAGGGASDAASPPLSAQLDPPKKNGREYEGRRARRHRPPLKTRAGPPTPGACVHERVFLHLPSIPEVILNYVSVRSLSPPIFPPLCSTSRFSIKFSSCWHFVHPPGPQIFIPAYHSQACGQCWIHARIRFLRFLPQGGEEKEKEEENEEKTCRHLRGRWTHNQSKNLKLPGSNAFTAPPQLEKIRVCVMPRQQKRNLCIYFLRPAQVGLFKKKKKVVVGLSKR